ncbi:MAG: purine-nucleoside phosphorylase [Nitrospinota bacterium]
MEEKEKSRTLKRSVTRRSTTLVRKKGVTNAKSATKKISKANEGTVSKRVNNSDEPVIMANSKARSAKVATKKVKPTKARTSTRSKSSTNQSSGSGTRRKLSARVDNQYVALPDGTMALSNRKVKPAAKAKKTQSSNRSTSRARYEAGPGPAAVSGIGGSSLSSDDQMNIALLKRKRRSALTYLKRKIKIAPKSAIVLGSGLGRLCELVSAPVVVDYNAIPGFGKPLTAGHAGELVAGVIDNEPVIIASGRSHYYETADMEELLAPIETLLALGIKRIILTTVASSIRKGLNRGDIMLVEDHINLMGDNPFFGRDPSVDETIFSNMDDIYDPEILKKGSSITKRARLDYNRGIIGGLKGPIFETEAERNMLRNFGIDAISMSIVPEAIISRYANAKVIGVALITDNGRTEEPISVKGRRNYKSTDIATEKIESLKRLILTLFKSW